MLRASGKTMSKPSEDDVEAVVVELRLIDTEALDDRTRPYIDDRAYIRRGIAHGQLRPGGLLNEIGQQSGCGPHLTRCVARNHDGGRGLPVSNNIKRSGDRDAAEDPDNTNQQ